MPPWLLFVAIRGESTDGNQFVSDAIARAVRSDRHVRSSGTQPTCPAQRHSRRMSPGFRLPDARKALATSPRIFSAAPRKLKLVGITGTNGKTTTSLPGGFHPARRGLRSGLFGTIEYRTPRAKRVRPRPPLPNRWTCSAFLRRSFEAGGTHAVLEASSHALALDRLWGCRFAAAVFTNLTRDHLDFHKTFEDYFAAKRRLFEGTGAGAPHAGIVNTR